MDGQSAFLRAICERPHDDGPRLVYADWLDEQGDPRGEFIRTQIDLARLPPNDPRRPDLARREQELKDRHQAAWDTELPARSYVLEYQRGFPVVELSYSDGRSFLRACAMKRLSDRVPDYHLRLDELRPSELNELVGSPWLKRLTGLGCQSEGWRPGTLPHLLSSPFLSNLVELRLAGHRGQESVDAVAASVHLSRLTTLDLRGNGLASTEVARLAEVAHLTGLTALWLGDCNLEENFIGPTGAQALAESSCFGGLHELELRHNPIGDDGAMELASADWPQLWSLELSHCRLGPDSAAALIAAPGLAALRTLELAGNDLGDAGAKLLAASPDLERLQVLDLSDNNIGEEGALALLDSPFLNGIQELRLDGNRGVSRHEGRLRRRFDDRLKFRVFGYL